MAETETEGECEVFAFNHLPVEVISHVFKFLPYSDLKEARCVCRLWFIAAQDPSLLDSEKVVCNSRNSSQLLPILLASKRDFLHFRFESGYLFWNNDKFWCRFGPKLKSLTICDSKVDDHGFLRVLTHCSKLRTLDIIKSDLHFRPGLPVPREGSNHYVLPTLPSLQNLKIAPIQDFNSILFKRIFACAPNLRTLSLNEIRGSVVLIREERYSITMGNEALTFKDVLTHVKNNARRPIDLCLGNLKREHCEILAEIYKFPDDKLRLRRVQCHDDAVMSDEIVPKCHLKWLQELEPRSLDDETLEFICTNLRGLKHLKLYNCPKVRGSIRMMSLLKNLTSLTLSGPADVDEAGFTEGLCSRVNKTLKSLILHRVNSLSEKVIIALAWTHPALTHLDLSSCKGVTDRSVQAVFQAQKSLESLILYNCEVSDAALSPTLAFRLKNLRKLDVGLCKITGTSFERGLTFPDIRHLDLRDNRISEKALEHLFGNNTTIEELNVEKCDGVCNKLIDVMVRKLLRLKRIHLTMGCRITEKGVKVLKSHCPYVRFLDY